MMKRYSALGLFFLTMNLQAQIQWQNPLPQGNVILTICFRDAQTGFAVGLSGTIMTTIDGGKSWSLQSSNLDHVFYSICFADLKTGFICGADRSQKGILLKTTDGGSSWKMEDQTFSLPLYSIHALNQNICAVGGGGSIIQSLNLGVTWTELISGTQYALWSVCFPEENTGYIAGDNILLKTINKGKTWTALTSINYPGELKYVWFHDTKEGYFFGQGGTVLKTTDGGVTFNLKGINPTFGARITSAFFTSRLDGYACGEQGKIFKTSDAGDTWIEEWNPTGRPLYSIFFTSSTEGFASGVGGYMMHTTNSGDTWTLQTARSGNGQELKSVFFINENVGYAVGGTAPYGYIPEALCTKDGGITWQYMDTGAGVPLNAVCFVDEKTGYAVGYEGTIIKTTDGGETWNSIIDHNWQRNLQSVFFIDKNTGFVVGGDEDFAQYNQVILKTIDAGSSWDEYENDNTFTLNSIFFVNQDIGFACGGNSNLVKTIDGGKTWINSNSGINEDLCSIYFVSAETGYCVGEDAVIYKTTNQGDTWVQQVSGFENRLEYDLHSVLFVDTNNGIAVGGKGWDYDYHGQFYKYGIVLKTTDGGKNWLELDCAVWNNLNSVCPAGKNTLIVCGQYGSLIKVIDDDLSAVPAIEPNPIPMECTLSQNYPNPFNHSTLIRYSIPAMEHVDLTVYDVLGQKVLTLVHERQAAGDHQVEFNGQELSTGVYCCRLRAGDSVKMFKMIILK
jgi:photosystem II stability/assembly factor-like uncharacterized protein